MAGLITPLPSTIIVRETADIPRDYRGGAYRTGRPGPVVTIFTKDVSALETDFIPPEVVLPSYQPTVRPNDMQIRNS